MSREVLRLSSEYYHVIHYTGYLRYQYSGEDVKETVIQPGKKTMLPYTLEDDDAVCRIFGNLSVRPTLEYKSLSLGTDLIHIDKDGFF